MNIKIESGANVQITDKPIVNVNVFGDVVQHKNLYTHPKKNNMDTDDAKEKASILMENKEFMRILQEAVDKGFCKQDGWRYKWDVKVEAAYFASLASEKFKLSKRKIKGKTITVSWKPFEALFGLDGLKNAYNDYKQCKTTLTREEELDELFE